MFQRGVNSLQLIEAQPLAGLKLPVGERDITEEEGFRRFLA